MRSRLALALIVAGVVVLSSACSTSGGGGATSANHTSGDGSTLSTTAADGGVASSTSDGSPLPTRPATATGPTDTTAPTARTLRPGLTAPGPEIIGDTGWTAQSWVGAGRPVYGSPAVFTTVLQPTTGGPPVGAARLDTSRLRVTLYAGDGEPAGNWTAHGAVASALWPSLVATFNSGFRLGASRGGYYADGRIAVPLRDGAASLVIFQDGSATVGAWGRDQQLTANVAAVRQNLELLVDSGRPVANAATGSQATWGFTLNGVISNWRSAVGVDRSGTLVYVGGPGLDPLRLATALVAVGAQRAMELDINPAWVSFNTFTDGPGGVAGTKLLAGMNYSTTHFLSPSNRDFLAVFAR